MVYFDDVERETAAGMPIRSDWDDLGKALETVPLAGADLGKFRLSSCLQQWLEGEIGSYRQRGQRR